MTVTKSPWREIATITLIVLAIGMAIPPVAWVVKLAAGPWWNFWFAL